MSERVRAEATQQVLLSELDHRVMNNLAAVQALAARIGQTSASVEEFQLALRQRLFALAEAQKAVVNAHRAGVPLQALAQAQLNPFVMDGPGRIEAAGPEFRLRSGAAVVLGLALHELGLNALQHGSLSTPEGHVALSWSVVSSAGRDELRIEWTETGGPAPIHPTQRGFGLRLVEQVLARELRGVVRLSFDGPGMRCLISAPLSGIKERRTGHSSSAGPTWT